MSQPRTRATWETPAKALASYMNQVTDLDQSWRERGLCRRYPAGRDDTGWTIWMADYFEGDRNPSERERLMTEKAKAALMVCANCPVQYDCAEFGARSNAIAGIYGMRTSNLNWLRRKRRYPILAEGRATGEPVEVFILRKRAEERAMLAPTG